MTFLHSRFPPPVIRVVPGATSPYCFTALYDSALKFRPGFFAKASATLNVKNMQYFTNMPMFLQYTLYAAKNRVLKNIKPHFYDHF